jgi:hypothetical protein
MNRRTALRTFALTGAAALLIPGCVSDPKKVSAALENLDITGDDEELMAQFADTLIPATDKPGAVQVGAHIYAFIMVDDCLPKEMKDAFLAGLRSFNESAPVPGKGKFLKASADEKLETLRSLEKDRENLAEPLKTFYTTARRYIIEGFTTSQYFLTEVKPYKLVPGPVYKGCVPLSNNI